jgi:alcohol dehydrogenase, propanol-preferring
MRCWIVDRPGPIATHPLLEVERPDPEPGPGQVLVRVCVCGVCRTDLHLAEGDLPPRRHGVIPGHEVVGRVERLGAGAGRFKVGDRIGAAWLGRTCSRCRFCVRGDENLCLYPSFTGWDEDGGYAELVVVREDYAYSLPANFDDEHVAPLLCAGIIGYRALRLSNPRPGGSLAIYGFGGSAHLAAQVAQHMGVEVHVRTRSATARELAGALGVATTGDSSEPLPSPADSALLFAPVGDLVPVAMAQLDRGGTLAVAGIYLSDIPALDYQSHLFYEKRLVSATANTRSDGREFLDIAAQIPIEVTVTAYEFSAADRALEDLAAGRMRGAGVLRVS